MISIEQTLVSFVFKHHIQDIVQLEKYVTIYHYLIVAMVTRSQAFQE